MKKASHLSKRVNGTLRNIKNNVGNFVTYTDGHKGGFKKVTFVTWKRGWTLKYLKTIFNDNRLSSELLL